MRATSASMPSRSLIGLGRQFAGRLGGGQGGLGTVDGRARRLFVLEDRIADVAPGRGALGPEGVELRVHLVLDARRRIR